MSKIKVNIEISAHHAHLSKDDYNLLFAGESEIKKTKELSQKGTFSTNKKVKVSGPKGEIDLRVLTPFRNQTQVELSLTDCYKLGISASYSKEATAQSTRVKITGANGEINRNAAIIPLRHLHCNKKEASKMNIKEDDRVSVKIKTDRGKVIFHDVIVRIADNYNLTVHLDTDEGNAAGIAKNAVGELEF